MKRLKIVKTDMYLGPTYKTMMPMDHEVVVVLPYEQHGMLMHMDHTEIDMWTDALGLMQDALRSVYDRLYANPPPLTNYINNPPPTQPCPPALSLHPQFPLQATAAVNKDGCTCRKCGSFNDYADSDGADGKYTCYGCRT